MSKQALVLGATGLVGTQLVRQLLEDPSYGQIIALVRRPLDSGHPKLRQVVADYNRLEDYQDDFAADAVFCCLGTTMKTAGSKEVFRRVDLDYPVEAARLAREAGARQFAVISALGARESSAFFYNRVKGEMERRVRESGPACIHVFQPSLLLGERQERRTGEAAASKLSRALPFLWSGPLRPYKPVHAATVAAAMRAAVRLGQPGFHVHVNRDLEALAHEAEVR
ncbi:oxidoreductase [Gorillibacterium sp. sgz5001074]|uniref:oxidoreductase n=1 Tax=Gorillibacterium sp. sgz5001074 TaxID=3446695 RepID=UPI003F676031